MISLRAPHRDSTLTELLTCRSGLQPQRHAYSFLVDGEDDEHRISYGELHQRACQWAVTFCEQSHSGDRVLLLLPPGLEFIASFFGVMHGGLVAIPAYPPHGKQSLTRLQAIIENAQPQIVVTDVQARPKIEALLENHRLGPQVVTPECLIASDPSGCPPPSGDADSVAVIQYTSGATAQPRGVMLTHRNLLHNSAQICQRFAHTSNSCGVIWLPPYHDMGLIGGVLQPLYAGFPVILMTPLHVVQQPIRWLKAITRWQATTSGGPNFAFEMCVETITDEQRAELDLSSWDVAFTGAEPVRAATLDRFYDAFAGCGFRRQAWYPCYGLAESTLMVTGGDKSSPPNVLSVASAALETHQVQLSNDGHAIVGCGRPGDEQQIAIVDPQRRVECPPEQVGEIWVRGPNVAAGYWNRPVETDQIFNARLADGQQGPYLRTGDLGFQRDGELYLTGRLKDLIIIAGRNHYPHDIELAIEQAHLAIQPGGCAAFSFDQNGEEVLAAVAEIKRAFCKQIATTSERQTVLKAIRRKLFELHELRPASVTFVRPASLAKTSSGKLRRHVCRAEYLAGTLKEI